jgi:UDP-N-acetylmuramoylalanine--D-glutamate ligase
MKIAIVGYGSQGKSAYGYWNKPENQITICDAQEAIQTPEGVATQLGQDYLKGLDQFDLIIRGPLVHPRDIAAANSEDTLKKVTTVTDEFLRVCPSRNIIGITGTKGKGTTSTLVARMLDSAGHKVHLGGNIGLPPLEMLNGKGSLDPEDTHIDPGDWVVLELANFQTIDLSSSPHIAVILMVEAEHMDWHLTMEEYIEAKRQLFRWQRPQDIAVYFANNENSQKIVAVSDAVRIPYFSPPGAYVEGGEIRIHDTVICKTGEIQLLGEHNWQNICAAVTAVWEVAPDVTAIRTVITSFSGLEHRLELVREANGVKYYDDSFGTTPATAIVALKAFKQPKIIILGGSDKGAAYDELAKAVKEENVRAVIVIGYTGPAIRQALQAQGVTEIIDGGANMAGIVNVARAQAQPGDVVLLSTACASFDMFENYKDRGEQFQAAVKSLA